MNNKKRKPNYLLRIFAGGYLGYLAYQLVTDPLFGTMTGWRYVAQVAAAVAFVGFGLWFIYYGIKGMYLQSKEKTGDNSQTETELFAENNSQETMGTELENPANIESNNQE